MLNDVLPNFTMAEGDNPLTIISEKFENTKEAIEACSMFYKKTNNDNSSFCCQMIEFIPTTPKAEALLASDPRNILVMVFETGTLKESQGDFCL